MISYRCAMEKCCLYSGRSVVNTECRKSAQDIHSPYDTAADYDTRSAWPLSIARPTTASYNWVNLQDWCCTGRDRAPCGLAFQVGYDVFFKAKPAWSKPITIRMIHLRMLNTVFITEPSRNPSNVETELQ